jgi:hypothetical protein
MFAFHTHKYHSINVIPTLATYSVYEDEHPFNIIAFAIEIILFGRVITIDLPSKTQHKMYSLHMRGPIWSRRRKVWYRALK